MVFLFMALLIIMSKTGEAYNLPLCSGHLKTDLLRPSCPPQRPSRSGDWASEWFISIYLIDLLVFIYLLWNKWTQHVQVLHMNRTLSQCLCYHVFLLGEACDVGSSWKSFQPLPLPLPPPVQPRIHAFSSCCETFYASCYCKKHNPLALCASVAVFVTMIPVETIVTNTATDAPRVNVTRNDLHMYPLSKKSSGPQRLQWACAQLCAGPLRPPWARRHFAPGVLYNILYGTHFSCPFFLWLV